MAALSVFTITQASGNGTTSTYTGSITSGVTPLLVGTPIVVVGCTTAGFNGTRVINGGNLTTTFTALSSENHIAEAETATGTYDPEGVQSYPTADTTSSPLGFGVGSKLAPYVNLIPYGDFIPGTLPGSGQVISI
jgi:hypothetical protein